ncbi:MAG: sigma-54 interaction domain-containing protein [Acidobacteriota bacterium]
MDISQHWQDICHAIQEGVYIVNPNGRIVMVNDAMTRLTGYSREELMEKSCTVLGCEACAIQRTSVSGHWCQLFAGRESPARRCSLSRKDGSRLPVFKNQSLIHDKDGTVIGAVESVMDLSELERLDRRVEELSRLLDRPDSFHGMVGASPAMLRLFDILEKAARSDAPVLLLGESGTGKELAARAIHELGSRRGGPFVQLNCAALNDSLLESELFGHAKGAFTGAYRDRQGRFEAAHGGDIFLDEIGDAPLSIQVKLLRVLETRSIERVGANRPIPVDVRLVTATHQDLRALIGQGRFREDFFFRINVIPIELPPLRARMEDLPLLAGHFLHASAVRTGREAARITPEAMRLLMEHSWPGNVRELRSALEYALVLADSGRIEAEHLPPDVLRADRTTSPSPVFGPASGKPGDAPLSKASPHLALTPVSGTSGSILSSGGCPEKTRPSEERASLVDALRRAGGNKSQAARLLGVSRLTVLNRMRKHGVTCERVIAT